MTQKFIILEEVVTTIMKLEVVVILLEVVITIILITGLRAMN